MAGGGGGCCAIFRMWVCESGRGLIIEHSRFNYVCSGGNCHLPPRFVTQQVPGRSSYPVSDLSRRTATVASLRAA